MPELRIEDRCSCVPACLGNDRFVNARQSVQLWARFIYVAGPFSPLALHSRFATFVKRAFYVLALGISTLAVSPLALADNTDGAWSDVYDWPLIAIHAALTPDGRVLSYGTDGTGKQTGYFIYDIWDPSAGLDSGHMTLNNMTLTDVFCSS